METSRVHQYYNILESVCLLGSQLECSTTRLVLVILPNYGTSSLSTNSGLWYGGLKSLDDPRDKRKFQENNLQGAESKTDQDNG